MKCTNMKLGTNETIYTFISKEHQARIQYKLYEGHSNVNRNLTFMVADEYK